jgi:hypothetical protein
MTTRQSNKVQIRQALNLAFDDTGLTAFCLDYFPNTLLLDYCRRSPSGFKRLLDETSGLLHDEAKYLINEYAWPAYNPLYEDRALLARKVIDRLYLPEIKRLRPEAAAILKDASGVPAQLSQELLRHELEMECLDYHYRISLSEGRRYVTRLIREAVGASLAGALLSKREGMRHEITKRVGKHEAWAA